MDTLRIDPSIQYDVVELPSRGLHYENNKKSLRVAYLNASDENILSSQNFIKSNSVIEELLKRKILDRDFNVDEITEEDKQAVLIFLRNTAWGPEYNVKLVDPKDNKPFPHVIDLSELKYKDFNLTPNKDGEFSYRMTKSNADITFKFLSPKQYKELETLKESYEKNDNMVAPTRTKELEMMIKSVNGNKDIMAIHNFVEFLPIKDSQDFKKFVRENKPGIDLIKEIIAPSGEKVQVEIGFGVEFFRPFYGI